MIHISNLLLLRLNLFDQHLNLLEASVRIGFVNALSKVLLIFNKHISKLFILLCDTALEGFSFQFGFIHILLEISQFLLIIARIVVAWDALSNINFVLERVWEIFESLKLFLGICKVLNIFFGLFVLNLNFGIKLLHALVDLKLGLSFLVSILLETLLKFRILRCHLFIIMLKSLALPVSLFYLLVEFVNLALIRLHIFFNQFN